MFHRPVLLQEVLTVLHPHSSGLYIDATVGDGGHSLVILEASAPHGQLLAIDQDAQQLTRAKDRLRSFNRATFVHARFSHLETVAKTHGFSQVDGILFDLGYASTQLGDDRRGLDYLRDEALLDMRLSPESIHSAADLLNRANEVEIADALYRYGDRHNSRTLAKKIVTVRRKRLIRLAQDLKEALGVWKPSLLAPIWQALRIWVNHEYDELASVLPQAVKLLKPHGILAIITFHSGEDRMVKQFLRDHSETVEIMPIIRPQFSEIKVNPRARSAKLRVAVKKGPGVRDQGSEKMTDP